MSDYTNLSNSIQIRNCILLEMAQDRYQNGKVEEACGIIKKTFPSSETIARINVHEILEAIYPSRNIINFIERMSNDARRNGQVQRAIEIAMIIQPVAL